MNENREEEKNDGKMFPKEPSIKKGPGVGTRVIGSRNVKPQCPVGMSGSKVKLEPSGPEAAEVVLASF